MNPRLFFGITFFLMNGLVAAAVGSEAIAASASHNGSRSLVLLTSLDTWEEGPFYLRNYYRRYPDQLEKIFREHYESSGFRVIVKHSADQYDLWTALRDPSTAALFWISHAANQKVGMIGLENVHAIVDRAGFNLESIFSNVGPSLQFLSVIGCETEDIIANLRKSNPVKSGLRIKAFDRKIDAQDGLKQAIEEAGDLDDREAAPDQIRIVPRPDASNIYSLTITRHIPDTALNKASPSVRIALNDKILAVMPWGNPGEKQEVSVLLEPDRSGSKGNLKLIVDAGSNGAVTQSDIELGEFSFSEPWPGARWKAFSDTNGVPLGTTRRVFQYSGDVP